jgi:chromosomal replication initiation ATPase DnaA
MTNLEAFARAYRETGQTTAAMRAIGIDPHAKRRPERSLDAAMILDCVAEKYGVAVGVIMQRRRHASVVRLRWEVMARMRALGWSLPRIGREMGMNHSTVLYGLRRAAECGILGNGE